MIVLAARTLAACIGSLLLLGLAACAASPVPRESTSSAFSLEVGDCMTAEPDESSFDAVTIVECSEPHEFEVFASVRLEGADYPGAAAIESLADPECLTEFASFVGIPRAQSRLSYDLVYPTEQSWHAGDREVLCRLVDTDDDGVPLARIGSLYGSAE